MTDARHPEKWLMDKRIQRLTAEQYRAFSMSLMWAVSNRTDGHLVPADLGGIPHFKDEHAPALVTAELWTVNADGWVITDYATTQTSRAQLEAAENARTKDAERKASERARARSQKGSADTACNPSDGPADNRSESSSPADNPADDVGKARIGKDRQSTKPSSSEKEPIRIEPAYPTDATAIKWRQWIDGNGITSEAQLVTAAQILPEQARKMWIGAFPELRAA